MRGARAMIRARANFDQAVRVIGVPIVDLCFGMADDSRPPTNSAVVEASYVATNSTGVDISLMDRFDPVMYASLRRTPVELLSPRPIAPR